MDQDIVSKDVAGSSNDEREEDAVSRTLLPTGDPFDAPTSETSAVGRSAAVAAVAAAAAVPPGVFRAVWEDNNR